MCFVGVFRILPEPYSVGYLVKDNTMCMLAHIITQQKSMLVGRIYYVWSRVGRLFISS